MNQDDMITILPLEIHYMENGTALGYLPRSVDSMIDLYLLNAWLQIHFLGSVGINNPYADIQGVEKHL